jgi:hypothetical protein
MVLLKEKLKKIYYSRWLLLVLIFIGIALRLYQYLINNTLWLDEAFIAVNIIRSNYLELFSPLKYYNQAAPIVFLLAVKFISKIWGISEFAFRFFPLLTGIGLVIASYFSGKKFLDKKSLPVFLTLIAFSRYGINYSAELKQYSLEMLATIMILIFTAKIYESEYRLKFCLAAGFAGGFLIFCSYTSAFIFTGVGIALFISLASIKSKIKLKNILYLIVCETIWLLSFIVNYFVFVKKSATPVFYQYWQGLDSFPPFPLKTSADFLWYPKTLLNLIKDPLGLTFHISNINNIPYFIIVIQYAVVILLIIFGTYYLIKNKRWFNLLIIYLPILVVFIVSLLGMYPLYGRLELFIIPICYLLISEGSVETLSIFRKGWKTIGIVLISILIAFPIFYAVNNIIKPQIRHETKPVMEYYIKNRQPEDKVYIYPSASEEPVYTYYTKYYFGNLNDRIFIKTDFNKNKEGYYKELLKKIEKSRTWIIFPFNTKEEKEIINFLNNNSNKILENNSTSTIYLFSFK